MRLKSRGRDWAVGSGLADEASEGERAVARSSLARAFDSFAPGLNCPHPRRFKKNRLPTVNVDAGGSVDVASSYQVYQWLRNNDRFAVVHFHDGRGLGYYTLLAQKQRLSCLHAHVLVNYAADGPLAEEAAKTGFKGALVTDIDVLRRDFMLRRSVELAETAIVADAGLLNKARAAHWTLPPSTTMVLADAPLHAAPAATTTGAAIKELVFLGDLNAASGLQVFMDAIDQLVLLGRTVLPSKITFVGQVDTMNDFASDELIEMRAFSWNIRYTIQSSLAGQDVVDYVRSGPGRLAVVPALHTSGASRLAHQLVLAGAPVIAAVSLGKSHATEIVDNGPDAEKHRGHPPEPTGSAVKVTGDVRLPLHGPKGELWGALLADGTVVRLGPEEARRKARQLALGARFAAQGTAIVTRFGRVVEIGGPGRHHAAAKKKAAKKKAAKKKKT